jgi:hypothetical protein
MLREPRDIPGDIMKEGLIETFPRSSSGGIMAGLLFRQTQSC